MSNSTARPAKLPSAWLKHAFWRVHRALCQLSGGRFLWTPASKRGWGALRLTTVGRKSGQERNVIIGYFEDGPNLVTLAMNGWDEGHPTEVSAPLLSHYLRVLREAGLIGGAKRGRWIDSTLAEDALAALPAELEIHAGVNR